MKRILTFLLLLTAVTAQAFAIEYEVVSTMTVGWYKSYIVRYLSVSADMTETAMVSGVLTVPLYTDPTCLILDNHYTITDNAEAPSVQSASSSGMLFSLQYAVAATDYIGYGATADQVHPYLCTRQNALNAIDMARVAWDIIEKEGIRMAHEKMLNVGYSQGGGVALAVHREMEQDPELAGQLHFGGSWCGDGPYDVAATLQDCLEHPDVVNYPVSYPMIINGFLSGAPAELKGDLKFSDFITDKMLDAGLETMLAEKQLDTNEINKRMRAVVGGRPLKVSDIFKPEAASPDGALARKCIEFAQSDCIYKGWRPIYPLKLVHLVGDEVVPVLNALNVIEEMQLTSDQYVLDERKSTHSDYGTLFYMSLVSDFDAFDFDVVPVTSSGILPVMATPVSVASAKRLDANGFAIERGGKRYDASGRVIGNMR